MAEHLVCSWREWGVIKLNYSYTFFSTNNLPNTVQLGEKKHNCYSLYNVCHCTASAVLSEGHCVMFRFCHVLPPLGSCTRIRRLGFDCQLSNRLAVGSWASHFASLGLKVEVSLGDLEWPFLFWSEILWLVWWDCCPLVVAWGEVRWEMQVSCFLSKPTAGFKILLPNVTWEGRDWQICKRELIVGRCLYVHLHTLTPPKLQHCSVQ